MEKDDSLGFLLGRASRTQMSRIHKLSADIEFYPGQAPIMFELWHEDGQVQKDLAKKVHLSTPTVNVSLARLEKTGLIERRRDAKDQRISRVYLTEKGAGLHGQVKEILHRVEEESFEGFTLEEKLLLKRFLLHIIDNLSKKPGLY